MTKASKENEEALVRSVGTGLAKSSGLVRRSLSLLTQTFWTSKRLFESASWSGSISPFGLVADSNTRTVVDTEHAHAKSQIIDVVDFAYSLRKFSMESLEQSSIDTLQGMGDWWPLSTKGKYWEHAESAVSFSWSPCGNYLLTGAGNNDCKLRFFDIRQHESIVSFRNHSDSLFWLDWSSDGEYVVSASTIRDPRLIVWKCNWVNDLFGRSLESVWKHGEITSLEPYSEHHWDDVKNGWSGFYGFGKCAFSPDSKNLIANASIRDGNDLLVLFELPSVCEVQRVDLGNKSEVLSLSWTRDSRTVFYCVDGELMQLALNVDSHDSHIIDTGLRFDQVACNPKYDVVALGREHYIYTGEVPESEFSPEQLSLWTQLGAARIEAGGSVLVEWSKGVTERCGDLTEDEIREIWSDHESEQTTNEVQKHLNHPMTKLASILSAKEKQRGAEQEVFLGGPISIRRLADWSIISEFTEPAEIVDLCWSTDGNKLWAMCRDGTVVQVELPIAFRQ